MNYENFAEEMLKAGLAKRQRVRFEQISKLLNRAQRDLKTAEANLDIDEEAVYTFAYLAMLRSGRALMFSEGFRPIDGQQHKTVVSFTEAVLGQKYKNLTRRFNAMRRKRNQFTYDPSYSLSKKEATQSLYTGREFVSEVITYIKGKNPQQELF